MPVAYATQASQNGTESFRRYVGRSTEVDLKEFRYAKLLLLPSVSWILDQLFPPTGLPEQIRLYGQAARAISTG
jgi:hypothetical protein